MAIPPIHPALVHFPIALILLSVFCDILGRITGNQSLRAAGFWSMVFAAIGGVAAGASGLYDMYRVGMIGDVHKYVDFHMWVGYCILAAVAMLTLWRLALRNKGIPVTGAYLSTAVLAVLLVVFQGFLGGEIVYSYGVGVAPTGQSTESAAAAQKRLQKVDRFFGGLPQELDHGHLSPVPVEPLRVEPGIPTSHERPDQQETPKPRKNGSKDEIKLERDPDRHVFI